MKQRFSYNSPMQVFLTSRWLSHSRTKFLHLIVLLSLRASLVVISSNNRRKKAWRRSSSSVLTHTTSALIYQSEFKLMTCFSVIETKEYSLHGCMHVCPLAQLCPALWDSMDCSQPGSSVMGFFRQENWSWLSFPPLGDLPTQRSNLCVWHLLHWQVDSLPLSYLRSPCLPGFPEKDLDKQWTLFYLSNNS